MAVLYPDNVGTFPFTTQYHFYLISSVPLFDVCAGVSHQFVRFYFIAKSVLIHLPEWYFMHLFKEKFSKFFVVNSYMYLYMYTTTCTSINTSFPWCPPNLTFCLLRYPIFYFSTFLTFFISWFEHLKLRVRYHFKLSTHFRVYNWTIR